MLVFADLHHGGLFRSLQLAGRRAGFTVIRPYGMEWFTEGFFGIAEPYGNAIETVKQFLSVEEQPDNDWSPHLNDVQCLNAMEGIKSFKDYANECSNVGITLDTFKKLEFNAIICSHPNNIDKFIRLRDLYQPNAKLIMHLGNLNWSMRPEYPNVWDTTDWVGYTSMLQDKHVLRVHQEFDFEVFKPRDSYRPKGIRSFVLGFWDFELYIPRLQKELYKYTIEIYGVTESSNCQPVTGISKIAQLMNESLFGLHIKTDDGYGHILHNWAACAVPLLVVPQCYQGRFGERLLKDRLTCLHLSLDPARDAALIEEYSEPEANNFLRENMRKTFQEAWNLEEEGEKIRQFFFNLV